MFRSRPSLFVAASALSMLAALPSMALENRVESVVVNELPGRYEVVIATEAPPTFQSFSRQAPALVMVDLVDTGVTARRIPSPGAPIEEIAIEPKRGQKSDLARLWLRFSKPVRYDVTAAERTVTLTVFTEERAPTAPSADGFDARSAVKSGTAGKQVALRGGPFDRAIRSDVTPRLAQADDEAAEGDVGEAGMSTSSGEAVDGLAMTYIGFTNRGGKSEVYARMNGKARFEVKREGENLMVLEIAGASIPLRNNKNHLDTTFFESPVKMVTPTEVDDAGSSIRIIIEMREDVPFETSTRGNDVVVSFKKAN